MKWHILYRSGSTEGDVQLHWKMFVIKYPILAQLVKLYWSMSAPSISMESMFSTPQVSYYLKRYIKRDEKLLHVTFINENLKLPLSSNCGSSDCSYLV